MGTQYLKGLLRSYLKTSSGAAALWAAIGAPVVIGGAGLSVDVARMHNLDQELQSAADAFSRAGAAELDQRSDALQRSSRAILNLVSNNQKFGADGAGKVEVDTIRYLKARPKNDFDPITSDHLTNTPSEARFVEVTVKPVKMKTLFPQAVVNRITDVTLSAKAMAGLSQGVCGTAPVFICNPFEGSETTNIYAAMEDKDFKRRQIKFKGKSMDLGPGNFGYLDAAGGNGGASDLKDALAHNRPDTCFFKEQGVTTKPGNVSSARQGLNVRFDIYEGSFKNKRNDPNYSPARNVTKGYSGNACKSSPDSAAMGLPRDSAFLTTSNKKGNNKGGKKGNRNADVTLVTDLDSNAIIGGGDWDFVEYMKINHNAARQITIEGTTYQFNYDNHTVAPQDIPSRYAMYRWEIDNDCVPGNLTYGGTANTPEEGLPQCSTQTAPAGIDRRIIHAAVLNCGAIEESGISIQGRVSGLPVETFVKVFVTEPLGNGNDATIYGEIVGPVVQGVDTVALDKVVVVR